jgi:protein-disulfide isomerase
MAKKKRRKLTRAQAKAEAQRRKRQRQIIWAVAGTVVVAVIAVLVLITLSGGGGDESVEVEPLRDDVETGVTEEGYPYRGPSDAPVTVIEYSDYNCPICGNYALESVPLVDDELVATGQVKYVVYPYALWEGSVPVVEAAVCAREQGKFWDFHHRVFANQGRYSTRQPPSRGMLRGWAEASGLNVDEFQSCLDEGRADTVLAATQKAKDELGVDSTPTFFVNEVEWKLRRDEAYIDTIHRAVQAAQAAGSGG